MILVLIVGFGIFFIWLVLGREFFFVLECMVIVMVICCLYVLGLVIFLVVVILISIFVKNGFFICNCIVFEDVRKIFIIVFDKIGIFIKGLYVVICIVFFLNIYLEEDIF